MEMVELEYKGCVITYPRIRIDTSGWTVNLASNDWQLLAKLGGKNKIFNDHHTLDGAIAQAKRYVDDAVK
jgi:hypothetical protein